MVDKALSSTNGLPRVSITTDLPCLPLKTDKALRGPIVWSKTIPQGLSKPEQRRLTVVQTNLSNPCKILPPSAFLRWESWHQRQWEAGQGVPARGSLAGQPGSESHQEIQASPSRLYYVGRDGALVVNRVMC